MISLIKDQLKFHREGNNVRKKGLRVDFFKKTKIEFLNPKESENGYCVSLLNRSIQDLSDHGVMLCKRNRRIHFQSEFFGSFEAP